MKRVFSMYFLKLNFCLAFLPLLAAVFLRAEHVVHGSFRGFES